MSISIHFLNAKLQQFFPIETWINIFIVLAAGLLGGSIIYLLLSFHFGLVDNILGGRLKILKRKNYSENNNS